MDNESHWELQKISLLMQCIFWIPTHTLNQRPDQACEAEVVSHKMLKYDAYRACDA